MRKLAFVFAFFVASFCAVAAESEITLDSVCESLSSRPYMTGNFTQEKTIVKAQRKLRSSGTFVFSDEGILWKTEKPFPSAMAVTLDAVIQTRADGRKMVTDASGNQIFISISKSLSAMFRGNKKELLENFDVTFTAGKTSGGELGGNTSEGSGSHWTIHLVPKDKVVASILGSIEVSGDSAFSNGSATSAAASNSATPSNSAETSHSVAATKISSILMTESSGDTVSYVFSGHKFPDGLTQDEKNYFSLK